MKNRMKSCSFSSRNQPGATTNLAEGPAVISSARRDWATSRVASQSPSFPLYPALPIREYIRVPSFTLSRQCHVPCENAPWRHTAPTCLHPREGLHTSPLALRMHIYACTLMPRHTTRAQTIPRLVSWLCHLTPSPSCGPSCHRPRTVFTSSESPNTTFL